MLEAEDRDFKLKVLERRARISLKALDREAGEVSVGNVFMVVYSF